MRAGLLRRRLTYQLASETDDAWGKPRRTWVDQSDHWGEVRGLTGRETTVALRVQASVSLAVETRFPGHTFDPAGRLVDRTDPSSPLTYNIVASYDPDGRRRRLVTMVTEVDGPAAGTSNP